MNANRIKQLRERLGYTQEDISEIVQTSRRSVTAWETGSVPNGEMLARLAQALQTSADFLLGLTDDPTPYNNLKNELSPQEQEIISSMRRGDTVGAIRAIVSTDT